jgi:hypothetical protein
METTTLLDRLAQNLSPFSLKFLKLCEANEKLFMTSCSDQVICKINFPVVVIIPEKKKKKGLDNILLRQNHGSVAMKLFFKLLRT